MHIQDGYISDISDKTITIRLQPQTIPNPDQLELNLGDTSGKPRFSDVDIVWQEFDYENEFEFLRENDNYGLGPTQLFNEFSPYVYEGICIGMDENGDEYLGTGIICFDEVLEVWSVRKAKPESYRIYEENKDES